MLLQSQFTHARRRYGKLCLPYAVRTILRRLAQSSLMLRIDDGLCLNLVCGFLMCALMMLAGHLKLHAVAGGFFHQWPGLIHRGMRAERGGGERAAPPAQEKRQHNDARV